MKRRNSSRIVRYSVRGFAILDQRYFEVKPKYRYGLYYKDVWIESYGNYYVAEHETWLTPQEWLWELMAEIDAIRSPKKRAEMSKARQVFYEE